MRRQYATPKKSRDERLWILTYLREKHEQARVEGDEWAAVAEEMRIEIEYPKIATRHLARLGMVERKEVDGKLFARITQTGLHRLARGEVTFSDSQIQIKVSSEAAIFFEQIAIDYKVLRKSGNGAKVKPSIVTVLNNIASRPEEFRRWYQAQFGK